MNNKKYIYIISALCMLLMISGCTNESPSGESDTNEEQTSETNNEQPSETNQSNNITTDEDSKNSGNEILIVIDQTPKPIEGNSFDFIINQVPEGFALAQMQWVSKDNLFVNSVEDAIRNGGNGGDGFYISGNGQYSGFIYSDMMKGDEGQVVFLFQDAQGNDLTWKKKLTLSPSANSQEESKDENAALNPQDTLEQYILAITNQDAGKLVELYGGSYNGLVNLFSETDPNDKQKLFEQYLNMMPTIYLKEVLEQTEVSKDEYKFVITLEQEDGSMFQTREIDTLTDKIIYTVKRVDGKLKMMELPHGQLSY